MYIIIRLSNTVFTASCGRICLSWYRQFAEVKLQTSEELGRSRLSSLVQFSCIWGQHGFFQKWLSRLCLRPICDLYLPRWLALRASSLGALISQVWELSRSFAPPPGPLLPQCLQSRQPWALPHHLRHLQDLLRVLQWFRIYLKCVAQ